MDSNGKWYSVKETAAILGWSVDTIRRLIRNGHLRAVSCPERKTGTKVTGFLNGRLNGSWTRMK